MLIKGMRVKLTDKAALGLSKRKKNKIDWAARRGVVQWNSNGLLAVRWEGRATPEEPMPSVGFERVPL